VFGGHTRLRTHHYLVARVPSSFLLLFLSHSPVRPSRTLPSKSSQSPTILFFLRPSYAP
jgi:hypothetical protein